MKTSYLQGTEGNGDNNNHDEDGIYDDGDQEEAELREGLRLFREDEGEAEYTNRNSDEATSSLPMQIVPAEFGDGKWGEGPSPLAQWIMGRCQSKKWPSNVP